MQEVHTEARRLAELKKEESGGSAYKASGLERVFGKEKETAPAAPTDSTTAPPPTEPAQSQPVPTEATPAVRSTDEKTV